MDGKKRVFLIVTLLLFALLVSSSAAASPLSTTLGTSFTYQGKLTDGGAPANGGYDFEFKLFDALTEGTQVGSSLDLGDVPVTNGLFTVQLDFGNVFIGTELFLEIGVRPGASTGTYTVLTPRQPLTPAPYALYAPAAGNAAAFTGALGGDVTGTQTGTTVTKLQGKSVDPTAPSNGQVLQFNGTQWTPATIVADAFWSLTGNSSTDPLTNFLGTLDNVALELRVNNARALRIEPNASSPNIIGGYSSNSVTSGVYGAVIAGGGENGSLNWPANTVTDDFGVVGGGYNNQAGNDTGTTSDICCATVGGGSANTASGGSSTVGGGGQNTASGGGSTVGGGGFNTASGRDGTTVGGGEWNTASGWLATVGGGEDNIASGSHSTVSGGHFNKTSADYASVPGGYAASATHMGEMAHASGYFAIYEFGDAQASEYVLRNSTTDATQTELFLDGSSLRLTLASNRTLSFDILIVAHASSGASAGYQIKGLIENVSGTTAFVGTPTVTVLGEDVAGWDAIVWSDDPDDALLIFVTGSTATTIRWVASVRTVEVGW